MRAQQNAGDPKLRYCANLGHNQDDESGLIYMRARYYEPASGRFVSEDSELSLVFYARRLIAVTINSNSLLTVES